MCFNTPSGRAPVAVIVDDHPMMRRALRKLIQSSLPGVTVFESADVPGSLELCVQVSPDLVFMDVQLPSGDGIELAREIKAALPATRIIVITGYGGDYVRRRALSAGADFFLTKHDAGRELPVLLATLAGRS